jgi:hypothetical protein
MRVIAIDWSGALVGAARHIWLAEAVEPGRLVRLEAGRSRAEIATHLLTLLDAEPDTVVGLDFAFSFPGWFVRQLGVDSGPALWAHVAKCGDQWLAECAPPFWGRGARSRPLSANSQLRRTEQDVPRQAGIAPKSIFQIGGAGSVGTGSIRGMPLLRALHEAGAHVWPFDPPGWPLIVEIYPRLFTGSLAKTDASSRQRYIDQHLPKLAPLHRTLAATSDDAFDAAASALAMVEHSHAFAQLEQEQDPELRLEGRIWHPRDHSGDVRYASVSQSLTSSSTSADERRSMK